MEYFPLVFLSLLSIVLIVIITRPLTILFHELGHAIPAILMTWKPVSVYIGSYGDQKNSFCLKLGLLTIWFKKNPFSWRFGLFDPSSKQISINKQIIYTITGPLASLVIALTAYYFLYDLHGAFRITLIIFIASSIFDLFVNLTPNSNPIQLADGSVTYNDGYLLKMLFHYRRFPKEYQDATELYNQQKFEEAGNLLINILKTKLKDDNIYRLAIGSFIQLKDFKQAKELSNEFIIHGQLNSNDYTNAGLSHSHMNLHDEAMELYEKSLELNPRNKYSINNQGFTYNSTNKFEEAIPFFDKALEIDPNFAPSYCGRGLSKIKTGQIEKGLADIQHSLQLDEDNSYAYRNWGVYYLDNEDYSKALELFEKAKELDSSTYMIDQLIEDAKTK